MAINPTNETTTTANALNAAYARKQAKEQADNAAKVTPRKITHVVESEKEPTNAEIMAFMRSLQAENEALKADNARLQEKANKKQASTQEPENIDMEIDKAGILHLHINLNSSTGELTKAQDKEIVARSSNNQFNPFKFDWNGKTHILGLNLYRSIPGAVKVTVEKKTGLKIW